MADCAVLGCDPEAGTSFHSLPKEPVLKQKWVAFVYRNRVHVPDSIEGIRVCSAHFTDDCFQNLMQKSMGFAKKLILNPDAVPTVYPGITAAATGSQHVCDAKPDSDAEEEEAEGERVPHAVAEMCLLTALRWQRQQREALPQHRRVLRELHSLASRKREMTFSGPAESSAAYAGGNPSKRTRPERAVQRWVRVTEEGEELGGGGLYTHGTTPELSRVEDLVKVEVEVEVADGAKLALGTRRRPGRAGAAPVSGGRAGAERGGESADFARADGRSSDKLKCEPAEISISDRAGADECSWG
ncbi:uncharacterized protein LOC135253958 isoform X1 [Anguilla rostrata]|uniref:uncharacterized protein LOC135253958 isoform X1 n=1 Tax=Anguilla rostrata TaxID=7938 RepID=UPI0030D4B46C